MIEYDYIEAEDDGPYDYFLEFGEIYFFKKKENKKWITIAENVAAPTPDF